MFPWVSRSLVLSQYSYANNIMKAIRFSSRVMNSAPTISSKKGAEQMDYIKSATEGNNLDWPTIKNNVLSKPGNLNQKNFEGVLLKMLVRNTKLDAALSFVHHIKTSTEEMNLGTINGILGFYYEIAKIRKLSKEEKVFILDSYKNLYDKYKVLDFSTCEMLIRALCSIDECEKGLKVLENIYLTSVPSHIAYSILIGALFRTNKKKKALEIINKSIENKRPLTYFAFEEWINYIFRKYKDKDTILKCLDEIYSHIARNYAVIDEKTAVKLKEVYESLGWSAEFTKIRKINGQCTYCKDTLDRLELSDQEFLSLFQNVKEKLIVGSDLFLKTSPEELKRFLNFVENTAPYDVVIDSLNIAYSLGRSNQADRLATLFSVVDYFRQKNKRILLLGRKHLLKWGKGTIERLKLGTCSFFTEDISQDDPFFITAAILSGSHTDIVSKDLLRGHTFLLKDKQLQYIFRRWQWQHQWRIYFGANKKLMIQPPLSFTPCAQKKNDCWHLPYERVDALATANVATFNDGTPDLSSWLCIRPKIDK